jgi:translation initiation factor 1
MNDDRTKLVYSTERDVPKTVKDRKISDATAPASTNRLLVRIDRKGRGGKSVTLIEGLSMSLQDKEQLLKKLKTRLGTGGTTRDNNLEIQGEHRDTIMTILEGIGLKPKRAGG